MSAFSLEVSVLTYIVLYNRLRHCHVAVAMVYFRTLFEETSLACWMHRFRLSLPGVGHCHRCI